METENENGNGRRKWKGSSVVFAEVVRMRMRITIFNCLYGLPRVDMHV